MEIGPGDLCQYEDKILERIGQEHLEEEGERGLPASPRMFLSASSPANAFISMISLENGRQDSSSETGQLIYATSCSSSFLQPSFSSASASLSSEAGRETG